MRVQAEQPVSLFAGLKQDMVGVFDGGKLYEGIESTDRREYKGLSRQMYLTRYVFDCVACNSIVSDRDAEHSLGILGDGYPCQEFGGIINVSLAAIECGLQLIQLQKPGQQPQSNCSFNR